MNTINDFSKPISAIIKRISTKTSENRVQDVNAENPRILENVSQTIDAEKMAELLEIANELFFDDKSHYEFKVHEKTSTVVCTLVSTKTGEILREIPSEKILDTIAGLCELAGLVINEKV